ncbi:hypothetical protein AZL_e00150 (plasmid) [Azospirillum sp. B510]|nr:hypothetical protein AZL_e00150 [Azospirillum sp. B510]
MRKQRTKPSRMKTVPSTAETCRCARCGIWHDQDRAGPETWLLVGPLGDPETFALCSSCGSILMRRRPQFLDPDTYLTLLPSRWPNRGRRLISGGHQPMPRSYSGTDRDAALRIVRAVVPQGFVVAISSHVENGRLWVRIDDAPFPAILPWRIIRFGNVVVTYSTTAPDPLTYPPRVAAVFQDIRAALAAAGFGEVDISLSQTAAERQAKRILDLTRSAHGRMQLAALLAAAGLDDEAIAGQLDWLDRTS